MDQAADITPEFLSILKSNLSFSEIVSEHLRLIPSGKNYKALCPFHTEKTPSFIVNDEKGFFYCFGCNTGGDVIEFVRKTEDLSFVEAVTRLAKKAGLPLPTKDKKIRVIKKREGNLNVEPEILFRLNILVAQHYHENLFTKEGEQALRYLHQRGLTEDSIKKFSLGFAPPSFDHLIHFFQTKKIPLRLGEQAGLFSKKEESSQKEFNFFDRFRNRVIFPIAGPDLKIAGFAGRTLGTDEAKYLNSPASLIFDKGKLLYGFGMAKRDIRTKQVTIIVEGYLDWLLLWQAGVRNIVATMGTALTPFHIDALHRQAATFLFLFDGDEAGERASERSINLCLERGVDVKMGTLPPGLDPADYVVQFGKEALSAILNKPMHPIDFKIKKTLKYQELSIQGRVRLAAELAPLLLAIPHKVERDLHVKKISEALGLSEGAVISLCGAKHPSSNKSQEEKGNALIGKKSSTEYNGIAKELSTKSRLERLLVQSMLRHEEVRRFMAATAALEYFRNEDYAKIGKQMLMLGSYPDVTDSLVDWARTDAPQLLSSIAELSLADEIAVEGEDLLQMISDCIERLKVNTWKEEAKRLKERIEEAEYSHLETKQLLQKYQILLNQLKSHSSNRGKRE